MATRVAELSRSNMRLDGFAPWIPSRNLTCLLFVVVEGSWAILGSVFFLTHLSRGCFAGGTIRTLAAGTSSAHRYTALKSVATEPGARVVGFQLDAVRRLSPGLLVLQFLACADSQC
jgi:hypothetical protein